jgi:G3E family GTPase
MCVSQQLLKWRVKTLTEHYYYYHHHRRRHHHHHHHRHYHYHHYKLQLQVKECPKLNYIFVANAQLQEDIIRKKAFSYFRHGRTENNTYG